MHNEADCSKEKDMQCAFNPKQSSAINHIAHVGHAVADDNILVHSISSLLQWRQHLSSDGPDFRYFSIVPLEMGKEETVFCSQLTC